MVEIMIGVRNRKKKTTTKYAACNNIKYSTITHLVLLNDARMDHLSDHQSRL